MRTLLLPCWLMCCALWLSVGQTAFPQQPAGGTGRKAPPPLKVYEGRRIAQTMHYAGAEWLIRDNREQEERCSLLLTNLGVKQGMTICDMGCGNGFYTLQLAKMVGSDGQVYGVDIQPEMLKMLNDRADNQGVENVTPVLGSLANPRLPKGRFDLILLVDVYHEFSHPAQMLAAMRAALTPDGVCALVEYRAEDPNVPIKPEHKMTKEQILKEWPPAGFKLVREFDSLPWQHLMFFGRDDSKTPPKPAETP
ncbi:MAG: class I SAM-dependent methyltransferase [Pirellulaceae bacterium]|nr:class I SAM-dependent methyltransferase [Pirellulaceae bacterium]